MWGDPTWISSCEKKLEVCIASKGGYVKSQFVNINLVCNFKLFLNSSGSGFVVSVFWEGIVPFPLVFVSPYFVKITRTNHILFCTKYEKSLYFFVLPARVVNGPTSSGPNPKTNLKPKSCPPPPKKKRK